MDFSNFWWQAAAAPDPGGDAGDPIAGVLRFRGTQTLSGRSGGSGTASVWIKRGKLATAQTVMPGIAFDAGDKLNGSVALFRDPAAWMHIVVNADGTYVNGERVANGSAITSGTIGTSCELYMTQFHFVDGQKLTPTTFGRYNSKGVWVPVDPNKDGNAAWYGSNGFYLPLDGSAPGGNDQSGNNNNVVLNGFETTDQTSPTYDIMQDSPTNNFATFNPLLKGTNNFGQEDANLRGVNNLSYNGGPYVLNKSTITINQAGGKYYAEGRLWDKRGPNAYGFAIGVADSDSPAGVLGDRAGSAGWWSGASAPERRILNEGVGLGRSPTGSHIRSGDDDNRAMIAVDYDKKAIYIGSNGNWIKHDNAGNITYDATFDANLPTLWDLDLDRMKFISIQTTYASNNIRGTINAGQQPFLYTPPAGFEPLSTANMPAAALPDTITGTFTGNNNADGPFVYTGCIPARIQYGTIDVKYQDRLGQTNVDFLSNGFKVRSTTSNSGTVNYTVTTTHDGGEYDGNKVPFNLPAPAVSN